MEQKDLDEINESFLGEEILDEDIMQKTSLESKGVKKTAQKRKTTKKVEATKTMVKEVEKKAPEVQIIQDEKKPSKIKIESVSETKDTIKKEENMSATSSNDVKIENATQKESVKPKEAPAQASSTITNPWEEDEAESSFFKEASTWKALTGILVILLIFSVFTSGFSLSDSTGALIGTQEEQISQADAEEKTLNYVNSQLLAPPFTAELESSENLASLYKVTLQVAGQSIDSYITKDGELFFPQGFDLTQNPENEVELQEPQVVVPSIDDDPMKGNENAPVTIIEFSDFECSFCGAFYRDTLNQIQENYIDTGKVRLVYRDFPIESHPNARDASIASECADDQGKFWQYHDALFENQGSLGDELYFNLADTVGLDADSFRECYYAKTHGAEVDADFADGTAYGVSGTPAFFINGKLISGAQPYSVFVQEIEAALTANNAPVEVVTEPTEENLIEEPVVEIVTEETEPTVEVVVEEPVAAPASVVTADMSAKKWLFNPRKVTVNTGDTLQLRIIPDGLDFTFSLSSFGVEEEISGPTTVEIVASQAGTFDFSCSSCEDWRGMSGQLVVE